MNSRLIKDAIDPAVGPSDSLGTLILTLLAGSANEEGVCWPSMRTIAARARVAESTARKTIRRLESQGFVETSSRLAVVGDATSNLYILHLPPRGVAREPVGVHREQAGEVHREPMGVGREPVGGWAENRWGGGPRTGPLVGREPTHHVEVKSLKKEPTTTTARVGAEKPARHANGKPVSTVKSTSAPMCGLPLEAGGQMKNRGEVKTDFKTDRAGTSPRHEIKRIERLRGAALSPRQKSAIADGTLEWTDGELHRAEPPSERVESRVQRKHRLSKERGEQLRARFHR